MKNISIIPTYFLLILTVLLLGACQSKPVPHLAADVIELEEGMSKDEVRARLGEPEFKDDLSDGEKWIYSHVNKSLLRKTPLIGGFMGTAQIDVVMVEFRHDKVTAFHYQLMTPEKFKEKGYGLNG